MLKNHPSYSSITEAHLPYCLTKQYQAIVAKIQRPDNESRGEKKTTGTWCKYEQND